MKKMTEKECKKVMLDILDYIDKICRKNNIKYSLFCGSLIGAIRHKGIIPWDDDIDIILLKEEYDKLVKILEKENTYYKIISYENTKGYYAPFIKVVDTRTKIKQNNMDDINDYGIFIDIFCYNNFPDKGGKSLYKKIIFYKCLIGGLMLNNSDKKDKLYLLRKIRKFFVEKVLSPNFIIKRYNKLCNKNNNKKCNRLLSNWPEIYNSLEKEIAYKDDYKEYIDVEFDGLTVMATKKYDEVLTRYFGDYMTPPPVEKRINHGFDAYWRDKK